MSDPYVRWGDGWNVRVQIPGTPMNISPATINVVGPQLVSAQTDRPRVWGIGLYAQTPQKPDFLVGDRIIVIWSVAIGIGSTMHRIDYADPSWVPWSTNGPHLIAPGWSPTPARNIEILPSFYFIPRSGPGQATAREAHFMMMASVAPWAGGTDDGRV